MILKVGKREVTCFSFDGGVQLIAFAINPSNWITLVGGLGHHLCEFNCPRKSQQLHFGLISAVIIGYFGLVTRVYAEVLLQSFYYYGHYRALCLASG